MIFKCVSPDENILRPFSLMSSFVPKEHGLTVTESTKAVDCNVSFSTGGAFEHLTAVVSLLDSERIRLVRA